MKMNFTMFILLSAFFVSFLQFADSSRNSLVNQNCDSKNQIGGNCPALKCPSTRCQKRLCIDSRGFESFPIAAIVVPICFLLLLVAAIFVTIKCVRSRQRNNRDSLKSENLPVMNQYFFNRRRVPGPPKTMPPFPPVPIDGNVDENEYDYYEIDNLRAKDNSIRVTAGGEVSTDDGYLTPNPPLGKPNFPPPQIPDS